MTGVYQGDADPGLTLYLQSLHEKLLTPQEEIDLAHKIQGGNEAARERMIMANLRFVVKIAMGYVGYGLPVLDLINEGNIGLMRAVERFNPSFGAKFSTYAAHWIKQGILRALSADSRTIHLPVYIVQILFKIRALRNKLPEGESLSPEQLAVKLKAKLDTINAALEAELLNTVNLEMPTGNEPDSKLLQDIISDEQSPLPFQSYMDGEMADQVLALIPSLPKREQYIIIRRFGLEGNPVSTLEEIGKTLKITRERVRQIEAIALKKLQLRFKKKND